MDLSIVIPTRNRAAYLNLTLRQLLTLLERTAIEWEIVVSNNHTQDATAAVLEAFHAHDSRIRMVKPDHSLDSAEENLDFGISQCLGDYVWLLGDDDIPELAGFSTLADHILAGGHDFIVYNSFLIQNSGSVLSRQMIPALSATWETTLDQFIVHQGFMYTLAGFSTIIIRRCHYSSEVFASYRNISAIYSHVSTFIDCYAGKPMLFVNLPLVRYRQNLYAEGVAGHWENVAAQRGLFEKFFWTLGFSRQLELLISKGRLTWDHLRFAIEQSADNRYLFSWYFVGMILEQLRLELKRSRPEIAMTHAELAELQCFVARMMPEEWAVINSLNCLLACKSIDADSEEAALAVDTLGRLINEFGGQTLMTNHCVSRWDGQAVYYHAWTLFTVTGEYGTNHGRDERKDDGTDDEKDEDRVPTEIMCYIDYLRSPGIKIIRQFPVVSSSQTPRGPVLAGSGPLLPEAPVFKGTADQPSAHRPLMRRLRRSARRRIRKILSKLATP